MERKHAAIQQRVSPVAPASPLPPPRGALTPLPALPPPLAQARAPRELPL